VIHFRGRDKEDKGDKGDKEDKEDKGDKGDKEARITNYPLPITHYLSPPTFY
jgi:hypothetical protein